MPEQVISQVVFGLVVYGPDVAYWRHADGILGLSTSIHSKEAGPRSAVTCSRRLADVMLDVLGLECLESA